MLFLFRTHPPEGTFNKEEGHASCTECPLGSVSHQGANECEECSDHRVYATPGQEQCSLCPDGMVVTSVKRKKEEKALFLIITIIPC